MNDLELLDFSIPVAFEVVEKTEQFLDLKAGKVKKRSRLGKAKGQ